MAKMFAKCLLIYMLGLLLLSCGGASSNSDVKPQATPTPAPDAQDRYYAVYEAYVGANSEVFFQSQLTRNSEPSPTNDNGHYLTTNGQPLVAVWASATESVNQLYLSSDVFESLLVYAGQLVRLTEGTFTTSYFNSLLNVNQPWYNAVLPYKEGEEYYVTAELNDGSFLDESTVVLPKNFAIKPLPEHFSRSEDAVTISWEPVEVDVTVQVQALTACEEGNLIDIQGIQQDYDQGFAVIDAGELAVESLAGECITTFAVIKTRYGELDPFFTGGQIAGNQYRVKSINSSD